jgi:hypothetical protein
VAFMCDLISASLIALYNEPFLNSRESQWNTPLREKNPDIRDNDHQLYPFSSYLIINFHLPSAALFGILFFCFLPVNENLIDKILIIFHPIEILESLHFIKTSFN